jgi:hypothetical protein
MLGWIVALFLAAMLWVMHGVAMDLQRDLENERSERRISDVSDDGRRIYCGYSENGTETIVGSEEGNSDRK